VLLETCTLKHYFWVEYHVFNRGLSVPEQSFTDYAKTISFLTAACEFGIRLADSLIDHFLLILNNEQTASSLAMENCHLTDLWPRLACRSLQMTVPNMQLLGVSECLQCRESSWGGMPLKTLTSQNRINLQWVWTKGVSAAKCSHYLTQYSDWAKKCSSMVTKGIQSFATETERKCQYDAAGRS
jgi:hypothetical protein